MRPTFLSSSVGERARANAAVDTRDDVHSGKDGA
jgi:hypothetical protein